MSDKDFADGLHRKFYSDMPQGDFYNKIGFSPEVGFIDRVTSKAAERGKQLQEFEAETAAGNQTIPELYLQKTGNAAGLLNDIVGEGFKSVGHGLSYITPDYIEQPVKDAGKYVASTLGDTHLGRTAIGAADEVSQAYRDFAQNNPRAARNVEAALNIGMAAPVAGALKGTAVAGSNIATRGAGAVVDAARSGKNSIQKVFTREPTIKASAAPKAMARDLYAEVDRLGVQLEPYVTQRMNFTLNKLRPKDPLKVGAWDGSGAQGFVDRLKMAQQQGGISISGASSLRSEINDEIKKAYRAGDKTKAFHLEGVKDALTKAITDPKAVSPTDYKGKNAWIMANHEFAKKSVLEELELLAEKAAGRAQPANSLDTAINNFLTSHKSAGLLPAERQALKEVTERTSKGELMKSGGTRLLSAVGAAKGGPVGFMVGHYGSMLSRSAAEAAKLKKLDKVYELISNRTPPQLVPKPPAPKLLTNQRKSTVMQRRAEQVRRSEIEQGPKIYAPQGEQQRALPSPEMVRGKEYIAGREGVRLASGADEAANRAARQREAMMGMEPGTRMSIIRNETRKKFGKLWDDIEARDREKITFEINKAFRENPHVSMDELIDQAKVNAEEFFAVQGEKFSPGAMGEALLKTRKK